MAFLVSESHFLSNRLLARPSEPGILALRHYCVSIVLGVSNPQPAFFTTTNHSFGPLSLMSFGSGRPPNHRGGRKYDKKTGKELPRTVDKEKAEAAEIFYKRYVAARQHPDYVLLKNQHRERFEGQPPSPTSYSCRSFRGCEMFHWQP